MAGGVEAARAEKGAGASLASLADVDVIVTDQHWMVPMSAPALSETLNHQVPLAAPPLIPAKTPSGDSG